MFFTVEKITKYLGEIKDSIYRQVQDIPTFKYKEWPFGEEIKEAYLPDFDDHDWQDFHIGESWGGYDKAAWFRTTVSIPEEWKNKRLVLHFLVGPRDGGGSTAEALLYVNGMPLQGIDVWHEEAWIPPEYYSEKNEFHLAIKAWSGVLRVPKRRRFKVARLAWVDEATEKYYFLADTVLKSVNVLDKNDIRRLKMLQALNESILKIDFFKPRSEQYYHSIQEALTYLLQRLDELENHTEMKPKVSIVGHSHIDMAWLWRLSHSREKAARTFSTALHLMKQYPEYRFIHTSPQLYKFLKEDYPEIFAKIKEKVATGQWEVTGGMWVESDTNLPNGESLIRQILIGKRFIREEFGVDAKVLWLPDSFGYTWALPQIMKKSGIESFMTTKISWNQYNRFPYDTFLWRGIDGTEILTHFITTPERGAKPYTYNGVVEPYSVKGIWDAYKQKDINDDLLLAFGWGDGGGGPTKEMIEAARAMKNLPGIPNVKMDKVESYFERLQKKVKDKKLPVWDDELYLEYHRGTYTSQASLKKANRENEILYHNAEWLCVMVGLFLNWEKYPRESLNAGWEIMLLNQFHDILPGSSIRQVNEDAKADYQKVKSIGKNALSEAQDFIVSNIYTNQDSVVVFNSLSFERNGIVELPFSNKMNGNVTIIDEKGIKSPVQIVDDGGKKKVLFEAAEVPACGYKTYKLIESEPSASNLVIKQDYLENRYYRIHLNKNGQIVSIFDKQNKREVLAKGAKGNVFQAFEDKPINFDAWDIDLYYQEKMREITELIEAKVTEVGPIRGSLKLTWKFFDSTITQYLTIYDYSPRIDFRTKIDWKEKQTLLKVAFPVNIRSTKATYDIQFGSIERPTHWNTSWDYARFEVVGHKWVDLSEGNYGVSLLNDCKYGHDVKDNVIRLTLIKSAIDPDETADRGKHTFVYSLLPHKGDWREGNVVKEAYSLNYPLFAKGITANENGTLSETCCFAEVDADNVLIETVKKAEDDDAIIVRFYEYKQFRTNGVNVKFAKQIKKAVECNLIEEEQQEACYEGNMLSFDISPFEIKTFKIWM
ncbi:alpha-mannosidase [Parageobacillus sp. VR-IP]|uniref:alpha-mannosidase n=1 Tax=Parageobacillus sp. VR-IP TaxID=2742205 RepID=UPI00158340A7|nr:alpha-mannosidase [Parageobacillus sp. VR-IP]NUK30271.1 alpha-mannosidase [Parageobacillus sp. VR-IP]